MNLPLERNGKIDKHSATFIPLCRVPCIVALGRLIFLKPNSFKNQNFYLAPAAQESTAKPALPKNRS